MKKLFLLSLVIALAVGTILGGFVISLAKTLPSPEKVIERQIVQSTKIFDRTGEVLLYEIHGEEKRTVVPLEKIPDAVKQATLAAEDANFYSHSGLDFKGILRAFWVNILSGDIRQGGSTITQQLVKSSLLTGERTITRKVREIILALMIESRYSKDEILNLYLNQIPYGSNAYGIEAAAETYFGKKSSSLTTGEAALLAALPKAPSYYSPYGSHKEELLKRKNSIIERMANLGFIKEEESKKIKNENINFINQKQNIKAPHFVMFVKEYLEEKFGNDIVERGGLRVFTTLDWRLQEEAEKIVKEGAEQNRKLVEAYNASLAAIDPRTGEILVMVGSKDFWGKPEPENCAAGVNCRFDPHVNITTRERQPGSAFKPFVYATAFKKGFFPETVLFDVPTEFNPLCDPDGTPGTLVKDEKDCYHPQNYDGNFRGPVSLRQAIAQSLNVPSVKLLYLSGITDSIKTAEDLGISTLNDPDRYGLSLVLGGAEVKLLEMVSAFGVFAQDGVLNQKSAILKIEDSSGAILEEKNIAPKQAMDTEVAKIINDVLSDNDARVPIFNPRSSLYFSDRQVAAKTGTTQDSRDAWVIGYTPSLVSGVWVGNNDNSSMDKKSLSIMVAGPIWHRFMETALRNTPPEEFPKPSYSLPEKPALKGLWRGTNTIKIDSISNKLATEYTPAELVKEIATGELHSILYTIDKNNPTGDNPKNPSDDSQFKNWEQSFQKWIVDNKIIKTEAPKEKDDIHTLSSKPVITLDPPQYGELISKEFLISGHVSSKFKIKEISLFIDDVFIGNQSNYQFKFSVPGSFRVEDNTIKIKAYDIVGNSSEFFSQIKINK